MFVNESLNPQGVGYLAFQHQDYDTLGGGYTLEVRSQIMATRVMKRRVGPRGDLGHYEYEETGDIIGLQLWQRASRSIPFWRFATPVVVSPGSGGTVAAGGAPPQGGAIFTDPVTGGTFGQTTGGAPGITATDPATGGTFGQNTGGTPGAIFTDPQTGQPIGNMPGSAQPNSPGSGGGSGGGNQPGGAAGPPGGTPTATGSVAARCSNAPDGGVMVPIMDGQYNPDTRVLPHGFTRPRVGGKPIWPKIPKGFIGISLIGDEERRQTDLFFPTDPRTIAAHAGGDPDLSTRLYDVGSNNAIDLSRGARYNTVWRVIKEPDGCINFPPGDGRAKRNSIAWNIGLTHCGDGRGGLVFDLEAPSGSGGSPPAGGNAPGAPGGGAPPLGAPTPTGPGAGTGTVAPSPSPSSPGGTVSQPQPGVRGVVGMASFYSGGGICDVGSDEDKHEIGTDGDGHKINSLHLPLDVYFRLDNSVDGPVKYDGFYEESQGGPRKKIVHFEWDGSLTHPHPCGSKDGRFRWHSFCEMYTPPVNGPGIPPPVDPPSGGNPPTPTPDTPGNPPTPTPDTPDTGGVSGGESGGIPGGGTSNPPPAPNPSPAPPQPPEHGPVPGFPMGPWNPYGDGGTPLEPGGIPLPMVMGVRTGTGPLPISAMSKEFASAAMLARPQFIGYGAVDFRNWNAPVEFVSYIMDVTTPITGRIEAYGRQSGRGWNYTYRPKTGRYAGGTGPGGFVLLPPEMGMEEAPSFTPTYTTSQTYFTLGPNARLGLGRPDISDGTVDDGWSMSWFLDREIHLDPSFLLRGNDLCIWRHASTPTPAFAILHSGPNIGDVAWKSNTSFWGIFAHANTANRTYTFPDASGTVALIGGIGTLTADRVVVTDGSGQLATDDDLTFDGTILTAVQQLRVGTATDTATQGDFVAGITGGNRVFWDAANKALSLIDSGGTQVKFLAAGESFLTGTLCVGTTATLFGESLIVHQPGIDDSVFVMTRSATNDDVNEDAQMNRVTTTDGTATTILTIPITASRTYTIEALVTARVTGGASGTVDHGLSRLLIGGFKTVRGTVTQIGTTTAVHSVIDGSLSTTSLTISGSNVIVTVTGKTDVNAVWHVVARVRWVGT